MMCCTKEHYAAYLSRIADTRCVAHEQKGFSSVNVIEREHNIGLADNIVSAVTEIVNRYGRVIAFEDDIVTTRGCLTYLNDALELYKELFNIAVLFGYDEISEKFDLDTKIEEDITIKAIYKEKMNILREYFWKYSLQVLTI